MYNCISIAKYHACAKHYNEIFDFNISGTFIINIKDFVRALFQMAFPRITLPYKLIYFLIYNQLKP